MGREILWGLAETKSDQLGMIMPCIQAVFEWKEGNKRDSKVPEIGGWEIALRFKNNRLRN